MPGWLTAQAVADNAEVKGVTASSIPLQSAAAAAETWVEGTARPDLAWSTLGTAIPADVKLGAMMLAWRWYQRRASPLGVVTSPTGDPVEILRNDPDIARLLGVPDGTEEAEGAFIFGASEPVDQRYYYPSPVPDGGGGLIGYDPDGTPIWNGPTDPDGTPVLP